MKSLDLNILSDGKSTGLSTAFGGFLAEAASVCLTTHSHPVPVNLKVEGVVNETYSLSQLFIDELALNSFGDLEEATEYGAMGIAIALVKDQKNWKVIRSYKGTGFDFWAGEVNNDFPFQNKMRVEISGKLKGTNAEIQTRLRQKLEQTIRSDNMKLPVWAIIVEFGDPKTIIGER